MPITVKLAVTPYALRIAIGSFNAVLYASIDHSLGKNEKPLAIISCYEVNEPIITIKNGIKHIKAITKIIV